MNENEAVQEQIIKELNARIEELKQECQSLSDENRARAKSEAELYNTLAVVRDALALDTVIDRTCNEHNEVMRGIVKLIHHVLEHGDYEGATIPY